MHRRKSYNLVNVWSWVCIHWLPEQSCPVFNKLTRYEPAIQSKNQHLVSGQLQKKSLDLDELSTWARDIWSRDTGQRIPCFDRCQLIITWMSNTKEVHKYKYAPTSNTASHDNHEKINSWVSFCFPYMGCLWGSTWQPFGPPELRYEWMDECMDRQTYCCTWDRQMGGLMDWIVNGEKYRLTGGWSRFHPRSREKGRKDGKKEARGDRKTCGQNSGLTGSCMGGVCSSGGRGGRKGENWFHLGLPFQCLLWESPQTYWRLLLPSMSLFHILCVLIGKAPTTSKGRQACIWRLQMDTKSQWHFHIATRRRREMSERYCENYET